MPLAEDDVLTRAPPEPDRLPTLTEVVQLVSDPWAAAAQAASGKLGQAAPAQRGPVIASGEPAVQPPEEAVGMLSQTALSEPDAAHQPPAPALDEDEITRQVLASLEPRLDDLFAARLREAMAPALARAADGLLRDLRPELTQALHDLVRDAVLRALQAAQPR